MDLRPVHVAVEVLWLALVLLFGYPYLATFYVAAFRDRETEGEDSVCPSPAACGDFASWLALLNLVPAAIIALGYAGSLANDRMQRKQPLRVRRKHGRVSKTLYWLGSVLGLLLIFAQLVFAVVGLHLLQSVDRVATISDGNTTTVLVTESPSESSPSWSLAARRRLDESAAEEIAAASALSHDGHACICCSSGYDANLTERCTAAFEAADGWGQDECIGSGSDCIYVANNQPSRTCTGNLDAAELDVQCTFPAQLVDDAATRQGSDEQACCETARICTGNSDPDLDVQCTFPAQLVDDAATRQGSDEQACCEIVGMCHGNTDSSDDIVCEPPSAPLPTATRGRDAASCCTALTCPQIECVSPKVPRALDPSTIEGSTVEECCVCAEDGERDLTDAYCVSKHDPNPEAENACTNAMKFVGCGRLGASGEWESRSAHCIEHPHDSECLQCKSPWPYLRWQHLAEGGSAQDLCMDAGRYACRYVFRISKEDVPCREGMCFNNTYAHAEPDVVCPAPAIRASHAMDRVGRNEASCCMTQGMCVGDTNGEPDIECEFPSRLRPNAELIIGRDQETCCYVTEMCVGNTDQLAEPDAQCDYPARLRGDASRRFRRGIQPCGGCCVTQGMCIGNDICEEEPSEDEPAPSATDRPLIDQLDVECPAPSELLDDAAVTQGRDSESCCETVGRCVGNTDGSPDVHCDWPALLRNNAEVLFGRTKEECCITQGMCVGNTDTTLEPDVVCASPAVPRRDNANIEGRDPDVCCVVTGYCAGNSDPAEEDIVCEEPRTPKIANLHELQGRSLETCCDCDVQEMELSEEYCVLTENSKPELDNQCTRVMKYAGCDDMEACIADPSLPACAACAEHDQQAGHSAFQILAREHLAQGLCISAGRYDCTYIYALDVIMVDPCLRIHKCIGNTDPIAEPDVVCPEPAALRHNAGEIEGSTVAECCTVTGYCAGNSDPAEEDIVCPFPSELRGVPSPAGAAAGEVQQQQDMAMDIPLGRSVSECCVTHGMCVGNSREPDYVCPEPFQLKDGAAQIRGRSQSACCWCEEHTEQVNDAYCWKTSLAAAGTQQFRLDMVDVDNECTEVMRYANCPIICIENGATIEETERMLPECAECAQEPPYPKWQEMSDLGSAQGECMTANTYDCTYQIDQRERTWGCELPPSINPTPEPEPEVHVERVMQACECEHSWLPLARQPPSSERQVVPMVGMAVLIAVLLAHFALRLYAGPLWHFHAYRFHSPCIPNYNDNDHHAQDPEAYADLEDTDTDTDTDVDGAEALRGGGGDEERGAGRGGPRGGGGGGDADDDFADEATPLVRGDTLTQTTPAAADTAGDTSTDRRRRAGGGSGGSGGSGSRHVSFTGRRSPGAATTVMGKNVAGSSDDD